MKCAREIFLVSTVTAIPNCFVVSFWFCSIANAAHISSFLQFPISQLFIPVFRPPYSKHQSTDEDK